MTVLLSWCPAAWALCWNVRTMDAVVFAFISFFFPHFSPSLLFASFFFNHASVSWFFCCASFIASSLTLSFLQFSPFSCPPLACVLGWFQDSWQRTTVVSVRFQYPHSISTCRFLSPWHPVPHPTASLSSPHFTLLAT